MIGVKLTTSWLQGDDGLTGPSGLYGARGKKVCIKFDDLILGVSSLPCLFKPRLTWNKMAEIMQITITSDQIRL